MKRMLARCALITVAAGAAFAITACAGDSPVSPEGLAAAQSALSRQSSQVNPGIYQLSFYTNGLVPATTLVAGGGAELILGALVTDVAGAPAQGGSVTFQYCSLKGLPPHDITRADEAPSSACASGDGDWASRCFGTRLHGFRNRHASAHDWIPFRIYAKRRRRFQRSKRAGGLHLGCRLAGEGRCGVNEWEFVSRAYWASEPNTLATEKLKPRPLTAITSQWRLLPARSTEPRSSAWRLTNCWPVSLSELSARLRWRRQPVTR